ncbi:MAG: hypothetical protein ACJAYJ_000081 [Saprospiraceae bacterium]|jgi:hypothetical protein
MQTAKGDGAGVLRKKIGINAQFFPSNSSLINNETRVLSNDKKITPPFRQGKFPSFFT